MRFLLYSDLHIRPERIDDCEVVLRAIPELVVKYKVDHIINGGDTFNTRGVLRTSCFQTLYDHYNKWKDLGISQTIIVGNHDQEDKAGEIHPMSIFADVYKRWYVIDRPCVIMFGKEEYGFSPYVLDPISAIKEMKSAKDIFVHWGFKGARRNAGNIDGDGVDPKLVSHFRRVWSGHYHYRNSFENIQYIGSPLQQNYGERDQEKGVFIYDTKTQKIEFVAIEGTKKHWEINVSWVDGKEVYSGDLKAINPKDHVRVVAHGDLESVSNFNKDKAIKKLKCVDIKLDRDIKEKTFSRMNIKSEEIHTPISLVEKYVDFVETDLDKALLLDVGRSLLECV